VLIVVWAVKGGSGVTTTAAAMAAMASHEQPTLLVDLRGDLGAACGCADEQRPGVTDWLAAGSERPPDGLRRIEQHVTGELQLLARGNAPVEASTDWSALVACLRVDDRCVVVDVGTIDAPGARELVAAAESSVLVVRPCFLALRRIVGLGTVPSKVVLIDEPGRALRRVDVEGLLGDRVAVHLMVDPSVSRSVDAGLLAARVPRSLRPLASLTSVVRA
jgi:hypothetical protein